MKAIIVFPHSFPFPHNSSVIYYKVIFIAFFPLPKAPILC